MSSEEIIVLVCYLGGIEYYVEHIANMNLSTLCNKPVRKTLKPD